MKDNTQHILDTIKDILKSKPKLIKDIRWFLERYGAGNLRELDSDQLNTAFNFIERMDDYYVQKGKSIKTEPLHNAELKPIDKIEQFKGITSEMSDLYERKNADYGDSFGKSFREYGEVMPCIRLEDKLNRLKSLTVREQSAQVNTESVEDTLMDIANYAVMSIIELRNK